jgi:hypothetical protein
MGYNTRQKCLDFINASKRDWTDVKIMVFDSYQDMDKPYAERLATLKQGS